MKKIIYLVVTIFILTSCGSTRPRDIYQFTSPASGASKTYVVKPVYNGVKDKAIYISSSYNVGKVYQNKMTSIDSRKSFSLNLHRCITDKKYNYYYGLGTTFGEYTFGKTLANFVQENDKSSFYVANAKLGVNYTISKPKIEYRLFGLELNYTHANGDYQQKIAAFPQGNNNSGYFNINTINPKSIFSFTASTEFVFKLKNQTNIAFGLYGGQSIIKANKFSINGLTFAFTKKHFTLSVITENWFERTGQDFPIKIVKYGLTYRLNKMKTIKKKSTLK